MQTNPYAAPNASGHVEAIPPRLEPVPTPWERRAELGWWRALVDTTRELLMRPGALFDRMSWDQALGVTWFFLLVAAPADMIGTLLPRLWFDPEAEAEKMRLVGRAFEGPTGSGAISRALEFMISDTFLALNVLSAPLVMLLGLVLSAGVTHVALRVLRKASGGWTATYRVFAYAAAPMVLSVVPFIGWFAGVLWWTVLQVVGLMRAHRISVGSALAGVVAMHLFFSALGGGVAMYFLLQWVQKMNEAMY